MFSYPQDASENHFKLALKEFHKKDYKASIWHVKAALEETAGDASDFLAKAYFLLGVCYEKQGDNDKADEYYFLLKQLYEKKKVKDFFNLEGIDPESLPEYRAVFSGKRKSKKNVIEKIGQKRLKKKRFPWTLVGIVTVIVIIGIIFTLLKTRSDPPELEPYRDIEWIHIPAGEFKMGDNFNEGDPDEQPVHTVYLDDYYISKYEVTFEQFDKFCEETGRTKPIMGKTGTTNFTYWGRGKMPVINVTWEDAKTYCEWLSSKTGKHVHLPTEAQWEKAARGTDQRKYPWGNSEPSENLANYSGITYYNPVKTRLVGFYPAGQSPYGIYEMAGNVEEWCQDWYSSTYYQTSPSKNPRGPASGSLKVIRGGSFANEVFKTSLRSADRYSLNINRKEDSLGFRVVKEK